MHFTLIFLQGISNITIIWHPCLSQVTFTEHHRSFLHFLTNVCAIVGGNISRAALFIHTNQLFLLNHTFSVHMFRELLCFSRTLLFQKYVFSVGSRMQFVTNLIPLTNMCKEKSKVLQTTFFNNLHQKLTRE
jgi:hypothetical protein